MYIPSRCLQFTPFTQCPFFWCVQLLQLHLALRLHTTQPALATKAFALICTARTKNASARRRWRWAQTFQNHLSSGCWHGGWVTVPVQKLIFLAPPYQLKGSNSWVGESLKSWFLTSYITFQMFLSSTIAQCLGFKLVQRDGETDEDLRKRHVSMVQGSEAKAVTHYEWHCKNWQWWNIFIDSDSQQPAALKPVCSVAAMIATIIKTSTVNNFYRLFG